MAFFGSSWNEDSDDYDGPLWGSGLSDHIERKKVAKEIADELGIEVSEVKDHMISERINEHKN